VTERLSADEARRLFLWAQGLLGDGLPGGPADALRRMGVVQLDTISVLARSHELVQYARLGPVPRAEIEAAYWNRPAVAFEFLAHAYSIVPIEDWPWLELRRHGRGVISLAEARRRAAYLAVLDRLADGPATTTELGGAKRAGGTWWDRSEAKVAAEHLLRSGHVVCVERKGWTRVYDLATRAIPEALRERRPSDHECRVELVKRAGRHLAVATRADLADYHRLLLRSVDAALASGETRLVPVEVRGWEEPAWADPAALEALRAGRVPARARHRTTLLSPFDPVVWDRARTLRIFGLHHRIEAYTPAAKRVYGYFAMPVLAGGRLVGRVDPGRSGSTFVAKAVDVHAPGDVPAVAAAIVEAASWVRSTAVVVERVTPVAAAGPLRKALASSGA
jgi:uncharacterized protein